MMLLNGKSLSKLGKDLDGQKYYYKDEKPQTSASRTRNNLQKRIHKQFNKICKTDELINPTFNTVSRDIKSSFTMRNTKDSNQNKYKPIYNALRPHVFGCKISKTSSKHQFDDIKNYETPSKCHKHSVTLESDTMRKRQKSLHNLDFNKQSPRKLHQQIKDSDLDPQLRFNNFQSTTLDNRGRAFSSYTKRQQLFSKTVHPLMINLREVKTHLFRKGWSPQKTVAFDKVKDKIAVRSDKKFQQRVSQFNSRSTDCLGTNRYSEKSTFISRTDRKPNFVKSQYHFRMCL